MQFGNRSGLVCREQGDGQITVTAASEDKTAGLLQRPRTAAELPDYRWGEPRQLCIGQMVKGEGRNGMLHHCTTAAVTAQWEEELAGWRGSCTGPVAACRRRLLPRREGVAPLLQRGRSGEPAG